MDRRDRYHSAGMTELGVIFEPIAEEMFHPKRGAGAFFDWPANRCLESHERYSRVDWYRIFQPCRSKKVVPLIGALLSDGGVFFRNASGALMLAYVASGRLLGYIKEHMNAWDCLAGLLMIDEASGSIIRPDPSTVLEEAAVIVGSTAGVS